MHVVIGGAFNGKRRWVAEQYKQEENIVWIADCTIPLTKLLPQAQKQVLILTDIENKTKEWVTNYSVNEARTTGRSWLAELSQWEKESEQRQVVVIATDFSKGIVPIEKIERDWRDLTGWFYQDLVKEANRVDEIWYGLGQQLK